jgi:hypothetical protein
MTLDPHPLEISPKPGVTFLLPAENDRQPRCKPEQPGRRQICAVVLAAPQQSRSAGDRCSQCPSSEVAATQPISLYLSLHLPRGWADAPCSGHSHFQLSWEGGSVDRAQAALPGISTLKPATLARHILGSAPRVSAQGHSLGEQCPCLICDSVS